MSSTQEQKQQKKSSYKDKFTPEQKEAYKQKKETEKQEYEGIRSLLAS